MPLTYVSTGLDKLVRSLRTHFLPTLRLGLFQNDLTPDFGTVIGDVTPATFSGYAGLTVCTNWTLPSAIGLRLVSTADQIAFVHSGGAVGNWIYGYYLDDGAGVLIAAERFDPAPQLVENAGVAVLVTPRFSERSEP